MVVKAAIAAAARASHIRNSQQRRGLHSEASPGSSPQHGRLERAAVNLEDVPLQLDRMKYNERLIIEATIQKKICLLIHFVLLMLSFITSLNVYDPIEDMSDVNANLRTLYNVDAVQKAKTPDQVLHYMQMFVETTYGMASALVDANTMDSIDPERCFSSSTNDVCRLKYWETPTRLRYRENYVDKHALMRDQVSLKNYNQSLMDCRFQPAASPHDCINWMPNPDGQLNKSIKTNAMGLTGEDPIIMDSRRQYPFRSVVALAPIVWQSRSKIVPCSGFGNSYNEEVLSAGQCSVHGSCDPDKSQNFKATKQNPFTNRKQSIFISYSEDAFSCVDHAKEATEWYDKSWHPWATMDDLIVGRKQIPRLIGGKNVFWKFITDTSYLMGPINGTIFFNREDPCSRNCTRWGPPCTDPIEDGRGHPMWSENNMIENCSMRQEWIRRFMRAEKEHRFIDIQTSEVTIASLVMTPQGEDYVDITTLVRVIFKVEQNGAYRASVSLTSVSDTILDRWYASVAVALCIAVSFIGHAVYDYIFIKRQTSLPTTGFDILCALAVIIYLVINIQFEQGDSPSLQLMKAFKRNSQEDYFESFAHILDFAESIESLKRFGFVFIVILFFRLVQMLGFHPRLGLIVAVVEQCADDVFHFFVQFTVMYLVLGFLGFWKFGVENENFRSIPVACYTLFRYFLGEFNFPDKPPSQFFIMYLLMYMFVVTIILVNFLLAIVVNAHTTVMENLTQSEAEKNVFTDIWDSILHAAQLRLSHGYPLAIWVHGYLQRTIEAYDQHELPAVTAEELHYKLRKADGCARFASLDQAQHYLEFYAGKMNMTEKRLPRCFKSGHYLGESDEDPLGYGLRLDSLDKCDSIPEHESEDGVSETARRNLTSDFGAQCLSIEDGSAMISSMPDARQLDGVGGLSPNTDIANALVEQKNILKQVLEKLAKLEKRKEEVSGSFQQVPADTLCSKAVQTDVSMSTLHLAEGILQSESPSSRNDFRNNLRVAV